jgi:hypothetical protein
MTVRRRFLHPLWLLISLPGYVGWRLLPDLDGGIPTTLAGALVLGAACAVIPLAVRLRGMQDRRLAACRADARRIGAEGRAGEDG